MFKNISYFTSGQFCWTQQKLEKNRLDKPHFNNNFMQY